MASSTDAKRWIIGLGAAVAIVLLIAFARNGPGVGGREPDPPTSTTSAPVESVAPAPTVAEPAPSAPPST